eukprot:3800449-Pleurochrysis_carterae.AAC.1
MHAFAPENGGLRKAAALLTLFAFLYMPVHAITLCVGIIVILPPPVSLLLATLRWARSPSQGTSTQRESVEAQPLIARATPLSCARADALKRACHSVAKVRFLTAAGCIALALIHSYWLIGHRVLGLREQCNPTSVTH